MKIVTKIVLNVFHTIIYCVRCSGLVATKCEYLELLIFIQSLNIFRYSVGNVLHHKRFKPLKASINPTSSEVKQAFRESMISSIKCCDSLPILY